MVNGGGEEPRSREIIIVELGRVVMDVEPGWEQVVGWVKKVRERRKITMLTAPMRLHKGRI